jgi:hypothetical protein
VIYACHLLSLPKNSPEVLGGEGLFPLSATLACLLASHLTAPNAVGMTDLGSDRGIAGRRGRRSGGTIRLNSLSGSTVVL